jgi:integrase
MYLEQSEAIGRDTLAHHAKPIYAGAGGILAQDVGGQIRAYIADRSRSVKPGTIRKELGLLRASLNWAERHGHIEKAPFIQLPAAPPPRDRRLTREEMTALETECKQPHLLLFVLIARNTAARSGAILSLKWLQVDFEKRRINFGGTGRQKGRAVVPMNNMIAFALAIAKEAAMSPYVIEYAGRQVASIKRGFAAACKRAGIEGVSPHILRHTAASWMAEAGKSMDEIAQFLGHTNSSVTFRVYARFSPTHLRDAANVLE